MCSFDKGGDIFYEQISALHKSVRGSSPDTALYWWLRPTLCCQMCLCVWQQKILVTLTPRALSISLAAWDAQERLGNPEGELALVQAVIYLASAPRSNAVYNALDKAQADALL